MAPPEGQAIWSSAAGRRDDMTFLESAGYVELIVDERTALVAAPWAEQRQVADETGAVTEEWRAEVSVGLKRELVRGDRGVISAQASAVWQSEPDAGCGEGGAELRLMGGMALSQASFLNIEAAGRTLEGGCSGSRAEITAGYRPGERWLALGQIYLDARREGEETVKAQLSLVHFDRKRRGVQVGLRARLDDGDPEPALVVSFWGPVDRRRS